MDPRPPVLRGRAWRRGPDFLASAYRDATPAFFRSVGRDALLLDVDGTLGPHGLRTPPEDVVRWMRGLRDAGIAAAVVSNAGERRMAVFCGALGVPYVARAGKPSPAPYRKALALLGAAPDRALFLGDQLYTDIAGARTAGVLSVLVPPVAAREPANVVLKRLLEHAEIRRALGADGCRRFYGRT